MGSLEATLFAFFFVLAWRGLRWLFHPPPTPPEDGLDASADFAGRQREFIEWLNQGRKP